MCPKKHHEPQSHIQKKSVLRQKQLETLQYLCFALCGTEAHCGSEMYSQKEKKKKKTWGMPYLQR